MASFKNMFLGASMLAAFAGLAVAQTASVLPDHLGQLRGEGITEALPVLTLQIKSSNAAAAGPGWVNISLINSGNVAITSPVSEIMINGVAADASTTIVGGTINFFNVPVNLAAGAVSVPVTGLKVNASAVGSGALSVSGLVTSTPGINAAATTALLGNSVIAIPSQQVATVNLGLKVTLPDVVSAAVNAGSWNAPSGFDPTAPAGDPLFKVKLVQTAAGTLMANDRVIVKITNIPTGLALYVPTMIGTATLQVSTDNNGAGGAPTSDAAGSAVLVNPNGGNSALVVYVEDAVGGQDITVPFYSVATFPIGVATAPSVISAGYAPLSTNVGHTLSTATPRFLATALSSFSGLFAAVAGKSTLVFPYVVTGNGWVTGIAINNAGAGYGTAADPTKGAAGKCTLNFYSVDGTTAAPAAADTASVAPGGTQAFLLDSLTKGAYSGLVVANCDFINANGFAYVTDTQTTAAYLAK